MRNSLGIVIIGATFVDIKGYPLAQFIPAGRNEGRVIQVHGGVCRNIAEDIARVDLEPTFISLVDYSGTSSDVIARLASYRVNTDYIVRTDDGLGTWLAVFDNTGDVTASISKRPDLSRIEEILKEHGDEIFSAADSIVAEFDIEPEILTKVLELAEKYGKKVYCPISNMSIAVSRRELIRQIDCLVCNLQEAELLFSEDFQEKEPEELKDILREKVKQTKMPAIVVTLGSEGAVYASLNGEAGFCPPSRVEVVDTTGAGDAFFAGVAIGLTYGKSLSDACEIGTRLATSVIVTRENVPPRFLPEEFGIRRDRAQ